VSAWIDRLARRIDTEADARIRRSLRGHRAPGYGFVDLPSCAVRYRAHGEGARTFVFAADPPIVLEHYDALVDALSARARIIVLELPGFGFSPARRSFDFSFDGVVAALGNILDVLDVRGATLCFPCVSAYAAAALALARPECVRSLVAAQAPSFEAALAWKRRRDPKGLLARPIAGQLAMHALKRRRAPAWMSLAVGDPRQLPAMTALAEASLRRGARWSLASAFQRFLIDGAAPGPVPQPILAVWGTRDGSHRMTDRSSSRRLGADVTLVEWDDVGHFPELESPRRFADLVLG
jgi:pimeloyl-ACP methyl ester carboxylesterase